MPLPTVVRGGPYVRVCKPDWADCTDTTYSQQAGGRWNPAGMFGALYLNANVHVAAAQARHQHVGRAIGLFDLRPERRPSLVTVVLPPVAVVDVVHLQAIRALRLPRSYPVGVGWPPCQRIGARAYGHGIAGVAARSAAEARTDAVVGEELAYFDSQPPLRASTAVPFEEWYPDVIPHHRAERGP